MQNDPRVIIDDNPMGVRQWIVVALMVALNALDGFDVLSSAFAAPGISREWGIPRDALGVVLSAELVGMGFGSVLLGGVADRIGRKPAMLVCLVVMAMGMYMAHAAHAGDRADHLALHHRPRHRRHAGRDQCGDRRMFEPQGPQPRHGALRDRLSARRR